MHKNNVLVYFFLLCATVSNAQSNPATVLPNIILPRDSATRTLLLSNLNGFLEEKEKPNHENKFVAKNNFLATSDLLDEFKEIDKNEKLKDDHFYKAYLTNVVRQKDSSYVIQLSYMGVHDSTAQLAGSFTLLAKKAGSQFYFSSPLQSNSALWKSTLFGNTTVHYKNTLNTEKASAYFKLINSFDQKLSIPPIVTSFYCCDNIQEALHLMGVDYKAYYNGRSYSSTSATYHDSLLILNGTVSSEFNDIDPHDVWHSRLHKVVSSEVLNKPVDEGTAYLYGGSWGLTWEDILRKFKAFAAADPNADWLTLYNESTNFDEKAKYPLNVDFAINALLAQKLEKEKGMSAVIVLAGCGKQEKGNANYFKKLEELTGITKATFTKEIQELINAK